MDKNTIVWMDYSEETNDPRELALAKLHGPRHPSGDGRRIPYSGWMDPETGEVWTLIGFSKLVKKVAFSPLVVKDIQAMMGEGYRFNFTAQRKERLFAMMEGGRDWFDIREAWQRKMNSGIGVVAAFDSVLEIQNHESNEQFSSSGNFG